MAFETHDPPVGPTGADCEEVTSKPTAKVRRIPELDGLRGLAVVAVVAYHAWPATVPGGWLGVSVFFTLSGYLITGILVRDHEPTRASLGRFWMTRARRLLPAALMTIVVVVGATALVDADSLRRVAGDALASIWYVQNWREAAAPGGYGAIFDSGLRPLAHMWSLSIEEQAYLLLPLLTLWLGPRRMLLVGGAAAAVATVVWWGSADAYYATPVRLVEVLAGASLAVWIAEGRAVRVPRALGGLAAVGLLGGIAVLSESDDLVSRGALPVAAVLSALVIAALTQYEVRALCTAPLTWLGHRSYAIYLFHWPLLVLLDAPPIVALAATVVLAELSHRLVEHPIRTQQFAPARPALAFMAATAIAVGAAGAAFTFGPQDATDAEIAAATIAALDQVPVAVDRQIATTPTVSAEVAEVVPVTEPVDVPFDDRIPVPPGPTFMILGESTAHAIQPALAGWLAVIGGVEIDAAEEGCSPLFSVASWERWYTRLIPDPKEPCRLPVAEGVDIVLIVDHGVPLFDHFDREADAWTDLTDPSFADAMRVEYETLIDEAAAQGSTVVFTTPPVPWPEFGEWAGWHTGTEIQRRLNYIEIVEGLVADHDHVRLIDVGSAVDADPERFPRDDGLHLDADTGAIHAVVDLIAPAFRLEP